jgi:pimeloyl-ACP methyl ester carboxylesterase
VFGRRFRCIALDNRGSGRSGKPDGPYSLEQMAADAIAVLDAEDVGRAHVVGHSMGSYIAQMMAVHHPDRIRSLTLAGTACRHQPWRLELLARWQETARAQGVHAWARRAFPWLLGPRTAWTFGLFINLLWPMILRQPAHAFDSQIEALLGAPDCERARLTDIGVPTLVVCGSKDTLTTPADAAEVAGLIPDARLVTLKGAGHGLMLEAAPDFNAEVLDFLQAVERHPVTAIG